MRAVLSTIPIPLEWFDFLNDRENILASLDVIDSEPAQDRDVPLRLFGVARGGA